MKLDDFTYQDLSIFSNQEEFSVFHKLDFTTTQGGRDYLYTIFRKPLSSIEEIIETQNAIGIFIENSIHIHQTITNGTIVVMEKFLDYQMDPMPISNDRINAWLYRILHAADFSMAKFSLTHFHEFVIGMHELAELLNKNDVPKNISLYTDRINKLLANRDIQKFINKKRAASFNITEIVHFSRFFHVDFKKKIEELISIYSRLDAWMSMAKAMTKFQLHFPEFVQKKSPIFETEGLSHLLLPEAVAYDIKMDPESNFIFLTGANMAGKSTFIKAIGLSCFLAHIGMGVPAKKLRISLFEGIITNINVSDNIIKGESYFFNEVKRIKDTIKKINGGSTWMVLIDELFKGTNIQDAMKCSLTVIQGLIKMQNGLFILSTHLYEIADQLKEFKNISFKYFETIIEDHQLQFKYHLKTGVSNDRIGYLILQKEGVVDMLNSL
ncbi:MAG: MutS-related protein [Chitinophagaceae bacterium]